VVGTAVGEVEGFYRVPPVDGVVVNELRAVVAVELDTGEGAGVINGFQALQGPEMGLVGRATASRKRHQ
jgi:hypothetical protein